MNPKSEALRLIQSLPDNTDWDDILRVLAGRAARAGGSASAAMRELRAAMSPESMAVPAEREGGERRNG
jgi:plasmid stability protein